MHGVPRFPFLWGTPEHAAAMRIALNLRYALIPHLYSLAHASNRNLAPLATPASWFFTGAGPLKSTYLYGGTLLPTDVSVVRRKSVDENTTTVWLPEGTGWYPFNSSVMEAGGQQITRTQVALADYVFYVKQGSLLALQGGTALIQHTGEIGGELSLHIYGGADATFTLYEDDGESTDYATARATIFSWTESSKTLVWTVDKGVTGGLNEFTLLKASLVENGSPPQSKGGYKLGVAGSVSF